MTNTRTFEELPVWQKSRKLTQDVYATTKQKPFCYDKGLVDQITRAAVSVMSNIAEGLERGTTSEFIYFLFIAKGSAGEVRAQLYVAEDQNYIDDKKAQQLRSDAKNICVQLSNWIKSMQTTGTPKGPKHNVQPEKDTQFMQDMKKWQKQHIEKLKQSKT